MQTPADTTRAPIGPATGITGLISLALTGLSLAVMLQTPTDQPEAQAYALMLTLGIAAAGVILTAIVSALERTAWHTARIHAQLASLAPSLDTTLALTSAHLRADKTRRDTQASQDLTAAAEKLSRYRAP